MRIGVPRNQNHEYRVGLIPTSVHELIHHGHEVVKQTGAGLGAGLSDEDYIAAGATLLNTADEIFASADMIVKARNRRPTSARSCVRARSCSPICT